MIGRGVSNQTERIGVDPALALAAGEPSARDLASPLLLALRTILRFGHSQTVDPGLNV